MQSVGDWQLCDQSKGVWGGKGGGARLLYFVTEAEFS